MPNPCPQCGALEGNPCVSFVQDGAKVRRYRLTRPHMARGVTSTPGDPPSILGQLAKLLETPAETRDVPHPPPIPPDAPAQPVQVPEDSDRQQYDPDGWHAADDLILDHTTFPPSVSSLDIGTERLTLTNKQGATKMPRKNATDVINAFKAGVPRQEKTIRTDGKIVWSYAMPIAAKAEDGKVMIVRSGPTRTTNGQINALKGAFTEYDLVESIRVTAEGVEGIG